MARFDGATPRRAGCGRDLCALQETQGVAQKLHQVYQGILAPLSLFQPPPQGPQGASQPTLAAAPPRLQLPATQETSAAEPPSTPETPRPTPQPGSPPSPVPAFSIPISLAALTQLIEGHLSLGREWLSISSQPEQVFKEIILAEVKFAWEDASQSLSNPALSTWQNKELYQQLVSYIILVSEHLFFHYLCLMELHGRMAVFTDYANLTRFAAQLSLDCSSLLNMAAVQRHLITELKIPHNHIFLDGPSARPEKARKQPPQRSRRSGGSTGGCRLGFTINHFIKLTRPHIQTFRQKIAKDIKELEEIPPLDLSRVYHLIPNVETFDSCFSNLPCAAVRTPCLRTPASEDQEDTKWVRHATSSIAKKSHSLPNMRAGQLLSDELGIHLPPRPLTPIVPSHYAESATDGNLHESTAIAQDLHKLVQGSILRSGCRRDEGEDTKLPPIIGALTRRRVNETKLQKLQETLRCLQEEEMAEQQLREMVVFAPPTHPQAATVNLQIHHGMVAKAADLQVSNRVLADSVAIQRYGPLYNDLLGEIDAATVSYLDANLSAGEEIQEIYKELMKNIPTEHLRFDHAPLIEPTAVNVDLSNSLASSTLTKRKNEQVINTELNKLLPAGPFSTQKVAATVQSNLPLMIACKQKISWYQWWKSALNSDDYLKYVSTKESDYLHVIFHLYNEGEEPLFIDEAEKKQLEEAQREVKRKVAEVRSKREKYMPGMWNTNTIMLGGLGAFEDQDRKPEDLRLLQKRLERLWAVLHFPDGERLDMAIKYSSNQSYTQFPAMLEAWEMAARSIQERELLLVELEKFEQAASDPNRFFERSLESFATRTWESRTRGRLYAAIAQCDTNLYVILRQIKERFHDTVTFKGRPYLEKMRWDKVEMLYWLQQERRAGALAKETGREAKLWKLPPLAQVGSSAGFSSQSQ
ncbi:coiled-coil domain-containing protein 87 [Emydura macquarii macquarii]|uniref:coiled-coil domain-containing protein 87 n=1 Tax=Emydura macquarii macquarii TaxID=1129001 RepID=UPI00352A60B8